MPTQIALPTASYQSKDLRASSKRLVNVFSEAEPTDDRADTKQWYPNPAVVLRRWPGIAPFSTTTEKGAVRGMWQMLGVVYAVIGQSLYTLSSGGTLTQIGTGITGTGFVRMTDNTACLVILVPNSTNCYTYTAAKGFQVLASSVFKFYGAIDLFFCDSYIVFLAMNGREFFNDDGQEVSGQGQITFTTDAVFPREFATDTFVGAINDHREPMFFGLRTSEGYVNAGNPIGTPFSTAPSSFMQIGCHPLASYSVALQDQSVFWVANDRTVRRRNGQTPTRVSNSGIESILEQANLTGCYALTPSIAGHPFWVLNIPAENRAVAYDCLTQEWCEVESYDLGFWRPYCLLNAFGYQLVGDSQSGQIGYLDTSIFTEFGNPLVSSITTQSVYDNHNRIVHRRIELLMTAATGTYTTQPQITMYRSDDYGTTYTANPLRGTGLAGVRTARAYWFNCGQSRDRVYKFQVTDPAEMFTVDIIAELEGGRW